MRPFDKLRANGVQVTQAVLDELRAQADAAHPHECCGLLLGADSRIDRIQSARNVHPTPQSHFTIDPQTLIDAHRAAREGGPQVVGYYHSHPNGLSRPSATDEAMQTGQGLVWAIVAAGEVTFWREGAGGFTALPYRVVPR